MIDMLVKESSFVPEETFECPFCKKEAATGVHLSGRSGILHVMPFCPEFESMDPEEYYEAYKAKTRN